MKTGGRADQVGALLQSQAAGELGVLQLLDRSEMPVDQAGVGERPQVLSRLELGRVRRQEEQVDVLGHLQAHAGGFPPGAIEHQHDLLGRAGPHLASEGGELHLEERDRDAGRQVEHGAAGGGVDKPDQVAPGEAVPHTGTGPICAGVAMWC